MPSQLASTPAPTSSLTAAERLKNLLEEWRIVVGSHVLGRRSKKKWPWHLCRSCQGVSRDLEGCVRLWRFALMIFVKKS